MIRAFEELFYFAVYGNKIIVMEDISYTYHYSYKSFPTSFCNSGFTVVIFLMHKPQLPICASHPKELRSMVLFDNVESCLILTISDLICFKCV